MKSDLAKSRLSRLIVALQQYYRGIYLFALLGCFGSGLAQVDEQEFTESPQQSQDWSDNLWSTPDQRTRKELASGNYDNLIQHKNKSWSGVGHFRKGDYKQAASSFAESDDAVARYNEATSLVRSGDFDKAIKRFDELLEKHPEHESALHNRNIASQLSELQEQQSQTGGEGDSEENDKDKNENQEQQQPEDSPQDNNSDSQQSEQDSQQNSDEEQMSESSQQSAEKPDDSESEPSEKEGNKQRDSEDASPEADQEDELNNSPADAGQTAEPLSEDEQAVEQWLRRIPDDPSGLLRRKILKSHQAEYPDVVDSRTPW